MGVAAVAGQAASRQPIAGQWKATWAFPSAWITWSEDERAELVRNAVHAADELLRDHAFAVALVYCLSLHENRHESANRSQDPLKWDRKSWSHLNVFGHVGVPYDPGNWMLYFAWQLLVARAGASATCKSHKICVNCEKSGVTRERIATLDYSPTLLPFAFVLAQFATPCLLSDHSC